MTLTFDDFWNLYPRKEGKKKAREKWERLSDIPEYEEMKAWLDRAIQSQQWRDPQYIPMPATFIYQERFRDDPPPPRRTLDETPRNEHSNACTEESNCGCGGIIQ